MRAGDLWSLGRRSVPAACVGSARYIASRPFYCVAYEAAIAGTKSFDLLERLAADGFNLLLLGPDGHPVEDYAAPAPATPRHTSAIDGCRKSR